MPTGKREHVDGDLDIEICLASAIIKGLQFLLNHPKTVAAHPEQEPLLSFRSHVDTGIKECSQQTSVAQQHTQQFIVVNVDVVKARCMKKIVTVDENRDSAAMAQLPGNVVGRIKIIHVMTGLKIENQSQ